MSGHRWRPQTWDLALAAWGVWVILADRPKLVVLFGWLSLIAVIMLQDLRAFWQDRLIEELEREVQP